MPWNIVPFEFLSPFIILTRTWRIDRFVVWLACNIKGVGHFGFWWNMQKQTEEKIENPRRNNKRTLIIKVTKIIRITNCWHRQQRKEIVYNLLFLPPHLPTGLCVWNFDTHQTVTQVNYQCLVFIAVIKSNTQYINSDRFITRENKHRYSKIKRNTS